MMNFSIPGLGPGKEPLLKSLSEWLVHCFRLKPMQLAFSRQTPLVAAAEDYETAPS